MRIFAVLLLLVCYVQAVAVAPVEEKDTGPASLPVMVAALDIDCESGNVTLALHSGGLPVESATVFLFRTDSAYRLLARAQTGMEGAASVRPPGKIEYLNDLYILRIEKRGFRTKEIEFTFWGCEEVIREYSEYSQPAEAPAPPASFANGSIPVPAEEAPATEGNSGSEGEEPLVQPEPETEEPVPSGSCMAIPALLAASGYVIKLEYTKKYLCILQSKSPKS